MPRTLTLLCFQQSALFPQNTVHWGLYLWDNQQGANGGTLFHAHKESLSAGRKIYRPAPQQNPMNFRSLRASVEVSSGLSLTDGELNRLCDEVAKDPPLI
ncbi:hypothetical protein AJ79_06722 [Helicocarpus griseus UAMH5409]|uniref:Uncharacterized protein n=1 Tax=Helicocarpus griseus UAMH5409 TaxID=1447875 RepID=A0A2B7X9E3_9EURO|nr:hypothetical protein AJ79_06722 [Helicocarpus griseus UAMH5409]